MGIEITVQDKAVFSCDRDGCSHRESMPIREWKSAEHIAQVIYPGWSVVNTPGLGFSPYVLCEPCSNDLAEWLESDGFVDVREGYRRHLSHTLWADFYHKKRAFVVGGPDQWQTTLGEYE